ncbi:MAG: hypothetical protein ACJ74Q_15290 [Pyrinomonadaceae bacterium]
MTKTRKMSRADRLEARNSLLLSIIRRALDQVGADCFGAAVETLSSASRLNLTEALTGGDAKAARLTHAIVLTRVEGDPCRVIVTRDTALDDDLWFAADSILKGMALALSPAKQETYDKFKWFAVWGDGQFYEDTFDLYHISSPHFETLTEHVVALRDSYEALREHEAGSPIVNGVYVARADQTSIGGGVFYYTSSTTQTFEWYQGRTSGDWRRQPSERADDDAEPFVGTLPPEIVAELPKAHAEFAVWQALRRLPPFRQGLAA